MNIKIEKPEMTLLSKKNFATEVAFNSLLKEADAVGLKLNPCMGLMYLPDQKLTRDFQEACRSVLVSLGCPSE